MWTCPNDCKGDVFPKWDDPNDPDRTVVECEPCGERWTVENV